MMSKKKHNGMRARILQIPAFDVHKDRLVFEVMRALKGLTATQICAGTEKYKLTGKPVSTQTVRNWYRPLKDGGTRYPQAHTMDCCLLSKGKMLGVVDKVKLKTNY